MVDWVDLLYPEPLTESQYEAAGAELGEDQTPEVGLRWVNRGRR